MSVNITKIAVIFCAVLLLLIQEIQTDIYTNTVIQAKQDVPDEVLRKLRSVLETEYELSDIQKLPDNEDAHIIVVIGDTKNR